MCVALLAPFKHDPLCTEPLGEHELFILVLHYFWSLQCLKTVFFFLHWEHLKASMIES